MKLRPFKLEAAVVLLMNQLRPVGYCLWIFLVLRYKRQCAERFIGVPEHEITWYIVRAEVLRPLFS